MERTPEWVRFLSTSRAEPEVVQPLQAYSPISVDQYTEENKVDIKTYLLNELKVFEPNEERLKEAVDTMTERSECVFLYVEQIRSELEKKTLKISNIDEFPRGLGASMLGSSRDVSKTLRPTNGAIVPRSLQLQPLVNQYL
jgi:hypothetical protein